MKDYLPQVSRDDTLRIINRDYPAKDFDLILTMLDQYQTESAEDEPHRVHLAILKMAGEDTGKLQLYIDMAKEDFRDVIAGAEYPKFMKIGYFGFEKLNLDQKKQIKEDDWQQYDEWLHAKESG